MAETHAHRRRGAEARGGESFLKWFMKNEFSLMESFLPELEKSPQERDQRALHERFERATTHAQRVMTARTVVTVLLVLAAGSTAVSTALGYLDVLPGARALVEQVAAVAAGLTLFLIVLRFLFNRYLMLINVTATYLGMLLANARGA